MEGFCRGCLNKFDEPTDLLQYCESNRRLFIYSTGLQVKRNDTFTFQLCKECYLNMKLSCKFKKQCRNSDKRFKSYLALKENGVGTDFSTYLKNADDTLALRLPVASRSATPAHQRNDDDDNESTCTSIQNFMSDMLQGEEMPPTEARIISEVIQEEADILDDSLDSHWLQDDVSENDFGMDFSLCGFSTPHSIHNDHCYTPRRFTDEKEQAHVYTPKDNFEGPNNTDINQSNDMPILDDDAIQLSELLNKSDTISDINYCIEHVTGVRQPKLVQKNDMPLLDGMEFGDVANNITLSELDSAYCLKNRKEPNKEIFEMDKIQDSEDFTHFKEGKITVNDKLFEKLESFKDTLFSASNDISLFVKSDKVSVTREDSTMIATNENEFSLIINKGIANEKVNESLFTRNVESGIKYHNNKEDIFIDKAIIESPFTKELDQFLNKAKSLKTVVLESEYSDKELNIIAGGKSSNYGIKIADMKQGIGIENIVSPLKQELEQYIAKAELKKNIAVLNVKQINDSIDKNIELALRNDDSQEISLDQLLASPQQSIRSGASTPTINNILFGNTSIHQTNNIGIQQDKNIEDTHSTDFIQEFLKDTIQSTKENKDSGHKQYTNNVPSSEKSSGVDEIDAINVLEDFLKDNQHKSAKDTFKRPYNKRGYKDIKKLKAVCLIDECDDLDNAKTKQLSEETEKQDDTLPDSDHKMVADVVDSLTSNSSEIENNVPRHIKEEAMDGMGTNDDSNISVSNLLRCEDSVDLNISICSDFLKDETEEKMEVDEEDIFKKPLSPPDTKYDLFERLCKICNKVYASQKVLKMHFKSIHKINIAQRIPSEYKYAMKICQHCGKMFRDKSNLNKHIQRYHDGPDSYTCKICTLPFRTKGRLSQHMRAHKDEVAEATDEVKNQKYVCSTCGKVSTTLSTFKVHLMRHTKSYKFNCGTCNKGFYRACDLEAHMDTHTKTFNFACEYCPKVYKRRALLMGHMYRHLNMTKFECDVCNKSFITKHLLQQHLKSQKCAQNRRKLNAKSNKGPELKIKVKKVVGSTEKIVSILQSMKKTNENQYKCEENMDKNDEYQDESVENVDKTDENIDRIDENADKTDENIDITDKHMDKTNEIVDKTDGHMGQRIIETEMEAVEIRTDLCLELTQSDSLDRK